MRTQTLEVVKSSIACCCLPLIYFLLVDRGGSDLLFPISREDDSLLISFGKAVQGMGTGELAVVLLVATSTHMDLTRIVASQPAVLSSEGHEKVITGAVKRSKVH